LPGWLSEGDVDRLRGDTWDNELVENEACIRARFEDCPDRPRLRCGYCGAQTQLRSLTSALHWFHDHHCVNAYLKAA
jgi:hypothetical protein